MDLRNPVSVTRKISGKLRGTRGKYLEFSGDFLPGKLHENIKQIRNIPAIFIVKIWGKCGASVFIELLPVSWDLGLDPNAAVIKYVSGFWSAIKPDQLIMGLPSMANIQDRYHPKRAYPFRVKANAWSARFNL